MSSLRIIWRICFVDSSDSSRIKSDCGHHHRGVAPEGATRAATDRPVKDRNIRFTNAQVERIWAIVSAHQAKALLPLPPTLHRW